MTSACDLIERRTMDDHGRTRCVWPQIDFLLDINSGMIHSGMQGTKIASYADVCRPYTIQHKVTTHGLDGRPLKSRTQIVSLAT